MSNDTDRNERGQFTEGNQASAKSGGGYGLERQAQSRQISAHLSASALEKLERIQDGGASDMHDEMAALALAVVDGLQTTFAIAVNEYKSDPKHLEKVYTASKHLHTWVATSARLLQWRAEHPRDEGKTLDYEAMIAKGKSDGDTAD